LRYNKKDDNKTRIENRLTVLDTVKIDDHSRLTFTKRIREIYPIKVNDIIIFYKDNMDKYDKLILEVQREGRIIDNWVLKRNIINFKNNDTNKYMESYIDKNPVNILLIEDEEDLLITFEEVLLREGYNVKAFGDSKKALYHLIEINKNNFNYYNLIITDIRMPNINGIQLYQIIKILNPDSKVLFVTGLDAIEEISSLFPTIQSQNILKKPFGNEHFIQKINDII
jgi:CheY-like chemotaxis protein